jgi:hypothetical protein
VLEVLEDVYKKHKEDTDKSSSEFNSNSASYNNYVNNNYIKTPESNYN